MVNQRYGDTANTPADGNYTIDRWQAWMSTGSKFSVTRSDDHPDDFHKSLLVTSLSAATVGADHEHGITTKIEGHDMAQLAFGTSSAKSATLSFYVKSSLTGTFGGLVGNSALNMSYVFSYTISSANTWERKTITIPPTTSGSFGTGSSNGLQVHFEFGVGSNRTAAVGWQTNTAVRGVSSQVNLIATNAATWRMTGLQLEVGSVATDFEHRSYGDELAKCQRYYQRFADSATGGNYLGIGSNYSTAQSYMFIRFFTEMRTAPSIDQTNISNSYVIYDSANQGGISFAQFSGFAGESSRGTGLYKGGLSTTAGLSSIFQVVNGTGSYLAASAEL